MYRMYYTKCFKSYVGNAGAVFNIDKIDEAAWERLASKMSYVQGI